MTKWAAIPEGMRALNQWMLSDNRKAPLAYDWGNEQTYQGSKNRTDQLMSFGTACELAENLGLYIGFITLPTDPFTVIDLDWKDKFYEPEADQIKAGLYEYACQQTYVEHSLSGRGAHIVVEGKTEHDFNAQSAGIECYGNKGFVVMTGNRVSQNSEITRQQATIDWLVAKYPHAIENSRLDSLQLDWNQINNASAEEKALDDQFAQSMDSWRTAERIESWFTAPGEDESAIDAKVMQLFVKYSRERQYPNETAVRMFLRSPRAKFLNRKGGHWQQYVERTFAFARSCIERDQKRLEAMSEGWKAAGDRLRAEAMQAQAPQPEANGAAPIATLQANNEFQFLTASQLKQAKPTDWLIKNLLIHEGIACVFGESGSGKSFLLLDMIAAIAEGKERWFDQRIKKQVPVCCLALEGQGGLRKRVLSWEKGHERAFPESVLFYTGDFSLRGRDLADVANRDRLERFCRALNKDGLFNGLIVVDTLAQASNGADENSARDMNALIDGMKFLRHATGSTVIVVHHAKKAMGEDGSGEARGSSVLKAAMDAEIEVSRGMKVFEGTENERPCRGWIARKVKDAADGVQMPFDLKEVMLGFDVDNELENGVYIEPIKSLETVVDDDGVISQVEKAPEMIRAPKQRATTSVSKKEHAPRSDTPITRPPGGKTWETNEGSNSRDAPPVTNAGRGRPKGGGAQQNRIVEAVRAAALAHGGKISYELAQRAVDNLCPPNAHQVIKNMTRSFEKLLADGERLGSEGGLVWAIG